MKQIPIKLIEFCYRLVFKVMLLVLGKKMAGKVGQSDKIDKLLKGKNAVIQFQTKDRKAVTHFIFSDDAIKSGYGFHSQPSLTVGFESAKCAVNTLSKGDLKSFLAAVQDKQIKITGDYSLLMWFMSVVKSALKKQ